MRARTNTPRIHALPLLLLLVGCAHRPPQENLPTYPWTDAPTALRAMAKRATQVKTINSPCALTLTRPNGESIRLDGALAISLPDKSVRIRAWKFNTAVFDLTLIPSGLFLELPRDPDRRPQVLPASLSAAQLARALSLLGPNFFEDPKPQTRDPGGPRFELSKPIEQGQTMIASVDRATLTVRQYRLLGPSTALRFTLDLAQYRDFHGLPWPTRMVATNNGSRIDLELTDPQLNVPLPPRAFVPPRGAEKVP